MSYLHNNLAQMIFEMRICGKEQKKCYFSLLKNYQYINPNSIADQSANGNFRLKILRPYCYETQLSQLCVNPF